MSEPVTFDVVATRRLKAEASQVFWFWEDGARIRQWWGPTGFSSPVAEMDFRVGGTSLVGMRAPEAMGSVVMFTTWTYTNILRNERIEFTLNFSDDQGKPLPDGNPGIPPGVHQGVRHMISFKDSGDGFTEMTITEKSYSSEMARDMSAAGLDQCLDKFEAAVKIWTTHETVADRYRRRADQFERTLVNVDDEQWSFASPCEKWSARDVVAHVVDMHKAVLAPIGRSLSPAPTVAEDPVAAFRSARLDIAQILEDSAVAQQECDTPGGTMTAERQIDEVVSDDLVLHGWDLATATGQDSTMDPVDVERLWALSQAVPIELMEMYRTPGAFGPGIEVYGPQVEVSASAPLQEQLLGYIGRNANWHQQAKP